MNKEKSESESPKPGVGGIPPEPDLFKKKPERGSRKWTFVVLIAIFFAVLLFREGNIEAEGVLKAKRFVKLGLTTSGILKELSSKTGDMVRQGDCLARFENPDLLQRLEEKRAALEILGHEKVRLAKRKEFLERGKQRKAILFENGAIGLVHVELLDLKLTQVTEELAMKEKEYESLQAENAYLKGKVESLELKAPFSGVLLSDQNEQIGNFFKEGDFVLELADSESFYLELFIADKDINKVKVGDPVEIRFRCDPRKSYGGTVSRIGPEIQQRTEKVFEIRHVVFCEIALSEIPFQARYGIRAHAKILPKKGNRS